MQKTYEQAIAQVFKDEGGYTNESTDPGGPTNWGITIHDARQYWKVNATAEDVKGMPKSIAEDIYLRHYCTPVQYNDLPAGVDYAVLDYAINSGISRASKALQHILGVTEDGVIGPATLRAVATANPVDIIHSIYAQRLTFLKTLNIWKTYGHGWTNRCQHGVDFAITLATENAPRIKSETWLQLLIESISKLFKH
jgi:lysozyme family protein